MAERLEFIMKRIGITLLLLVCLSVTAFADTAAPDTEAAEAAEPVSVSLTLEKAVEMGLANSTALKAQEASLDKSEAALEQQYTEYFRANNSALSYGTPDTILVKTGYYNRAAQMGVLLSQKNLEKSRLLLSFSIESAYFSYQNMLEQQTILKSALGLAEENKDQVEIKLSVGMATEIEKAAAENALRSAKVDYDKSVRDTDYARMSLCSQLSLPLDTELILTDTLTYEPYEEVNISEKAQEALKNRVDMLSAREQAEVDAMYYTSVRKYYTENTYAARQAKSAADASAENVKTMENNVVLSVYQAYYQMQSAYDSIAVARANAELAEKQLTVAKIKFEQDLGTNTEVITALNNASSAKLGYAQTVLGYNLAEKQFIYSYGLGIQ